MKQSILDKNVTDFSYTRVIQRDREIVKRIANSGGETFA